MRAPDAPLSSQRLGEFLGYLSSVSDEPTVLRTAVERAAVALEAEVAVVVSDDQVLGSIGFAEGRVPVAVLVEAVAGRRDQIRVPGAGLCHVAVAPLNRNNLGHLLVARSGDEDFRSEEVGLLRGMARALELTLETVRTMAAERRLMASLQQRQLLLEQISEIQRAITRREHPQMVLDSITLGAHRLIGDDVVMLWLRDPEDDGMLVLASSRGVGPGHSRMLKRTPIALAGAAGRALEANRLVVGEPVSLHRPDPESPDRPVAVAMAAPVHEMGRVVGTLEVASRTADRVYSTADQEMLRVFSEQVSLAVTDARAHEQIRQAYHDPLTGLASRRLFKDLLDRALDEARVLGTRVAVLFVDLDSFKIVNDSLGHAAGDELLVEVAARLRACIGERDVAARLGGDEFAVVIVDLCDEQPAVQVAEGIIEAVRAPFLIEGKEAFVDVSIGVALNTPVAAGTPGGDPDGDSLLGEADLAMYQAKRRGKGRCEVFRPQLREEFVRRLDTEAELRHAVEREELVLHYQPIFDLREGTLVGVEALMRWRHPRRGLLPPGEFIGLAEETGLIVPMEVWALSEACRQVAAWSRLPGCANLAVTVNLSVRQVQRPELAEVVSQALQDTGLPPGQLILEITESLFLQGTEAIVDRLRCLERLRVRLAVDDFGTGYSSLSYLSHLPIHIIKIDKSFVDGLADGPLARAIVHLGRTLGLVTLAEGIEASHQLEALRDAGCHLGQGFYFAKPLPADDMEGLLTGPLHELDWVCTPRS